MKILIVTKQQIELGQMIGQKITQAGEELMISHHFDDAAAEVVVWLPSAATVDDAVFDLVTAIDQGAVKPRKIIMLAVAGINDEVESTRLQQRFGQQCSDVILAYQYAVKMIDELELPYTIIRAAKTVTKTTTSVISNEGQPVVGTQIGSSELSQLIVKTVLTDQYLNQSIGIADN